MPSPAAAGRLTNSGKSAQRCRDNQGPLAPVISYFLDLKTLEKAVMNTYCEGRNKTSFLIVPVLP